MTEKEHPPSANKIAKARKNGDVIHSKALSIGAGMCAAVVSILSMSGWRGHTDHLWNLEEYASPIHAISHAMWVICRSTITPLMISLFASVGISLLQTRGLAHFAALKPKLSQVGFGSWCRKVRGGMSEVIFGVLKATLLVVLVAPLWSHAALIVQEILRLSSGYKVSWEGAHFLVGSLLLGSMVRCCQGLLVIGAISYWWTRRRFMKRQMMSLHDLREEHREQEGDPHMKSLRRHEHEGLLTSELVERVRKAKVVIVSRRPSVTV